MLQSDFAGKWRGELVEGVGDRPPTLSTNSPLHLQSKLLCERLAQKKLSKITKEIHPRRWDMLSPDLNFLVLLAIGNDAHNSTSFNLKKTCIMFVYHPSANCCSQFFCKAIWTFICQNDHKYYPNASAIYTSRFLIYDLKWQLKSNKKSILQIT